MEEILKFKEEGNKYFNQKNYEKSIEFYTKGIKSIETMLSTRRTLSATPEHDTLRNITVALFCNRANAYNRIGHHRRALEDGSAALMCNGKAFKAHYRCGSALMGLGRYKDAEKSFQQAADLCTDKASKADALRMVQEAEERSLGPRCTKETRLDLSAESSSQPQQSLTATKTTINTPNNINAPSNNNTSITNTFNKANLVMTINLEQLLAHLNASQWWYEEGKSTIQVFEERLAATEGISDITQVKGPMRDSAEQLRLFVVPADYDGPRVSRPPTMAEVRALAEYFRTGHKPLHPRYAATIAIDAWKTFRELPSLVDVAVPAGTQFTICGDVHGQFHDMLQIFEMNGWPSATNPYLFNGDYVDRGSYSCEVLLTLFALRAACPEAMHLARGNHETINMNYVYGFSSEVSDKYHKSFDTLMTEIFNYLPLAHTLGGKVFVVHGGLSADDNLEPPSLDEIRRIDRVRQPPEEGGLMSDLLWADPHEAHGRIPSRRGVGYSFGADITKRFLEKNGLSMVVRSHEVKAGGYELHHDGMLATVFSAPNYCNRLGNMGAYVKFKAPEFKPEFVSFKHSPRRIQEEVPPMHYVKSSVKKLGELGLI